MHSSSEVQVTVHGFFRRNKVLILSLFISFLLRLILAIKGGQLYWPDEKGYMTSHQLLPLLRDGNIRGALFLISGIHAHTGFLFLAIIIEILRYILLSLCMPDMVLHPALLLKSTDTLWIAALVLSMASIVSLALVYAIARKSGAGKREGIIAVLMMACSTAMFYPSRHLQPYDMSMTTALFAVWLGLDMKTSIRKSLAVGIVAGLSFLVYNGYWILALIAILIHISWSKDLKKEIVRRVIMAALGFVMVPGMLAVSSAAVGNTSYLSRMIEFSKTVKTGDFTEGWSLVWAYLWHTEHGLLLVWIVSVGVVLWLLLKRRQLIPARATTWLLALVSIYFILFLCSTILEKQVVYGRTAKQMVPFLCLTTAYVFEAISDRYKKSKKWQLLSVLIATIILAQVVINFKGPLMQRFPAEVYQSIKMKYGCVSRDLTIVGAKVEREDITKCSDDYVLLNAQYHLDPFLGTKPLPAGVVLFQADHPWQYIPYQYEGPSPQQRLLLRTHDISMRLIHKEK